MTNGKTILVVDDESLVRVLVKRILFEQGYRVFEAASGEQHGTTLGPGADPRFRGPAAAWGISQSGAS